MHAGINQHDIEPDIHTIILSMRVEETFSRFHHSFPLAPVDDKIEIVRSPVGPRLYLNKDNRIGVERYYINFPASCPPVARENLPA